RGHATVALPTNLMKSRRLICPPRLRRNYRNALTYSLEGVRAHNVRFGSEADMCSAINHVCFTPDCNHKSRHRLITRLVLWSATEEFDHASRSDPNSIRTHQSLLEQRQINWSQAAAPTEACLGNPRHAPK